MPDIPLFVQVMHDWMALLAWVLLGGPQDCGYQGRRPSNGLVGTLCKNVLELTIPFKVCTPRLAEQFEDLVRELRYFATDKVILMQNVLSLNHGFCAQRTYQIRPSRYKTNMVQSHCSQGRSRAVLRPKARFIRWIGLVSFMVSQGSASATIL